MIEIRFHGRGGQGAVTAAEILAKAAISEGKYAQGFPNFGAERRGAPVMAFLRISEKPIYIRERIDTPDVVVVLDPSLLGLVDFCSGLKTAGQLIINIPQKREKDLIPFKSKYQVAFLDATMVALKNMGVPIANTAMMGAFIKVTEAIGMEALREFIRERFGRIADKNLAAVEMAYEKTVIWDAPPIAEDMDEKAADEYPIEALHPWNELEIGGDITRAGSSKDFLTGDWRTTGRPVSDLDKCTKCGLCWIVCPDMVYSKNEEGFYDWDGLYCKGCGICADQCPAGAIIMRSET